MSEDYKAMCIDRLMHGASGTVYSRNPHHNKHTRECTDEIKRRLRKLKRIEDKKKRLARSK